MVCIYEGVSHQRGWPHSHSTAALVERRAHPLQGSPSVPCHSYEDATGAATHSICADKPVGRPPRRADFWIGRGHLRFLYDKQINAAVLRLRMATALLVFP